MELMMMALVIGVVFFAYQITLILIMLRKNQDPMERLAMSLNNEIVNEHRAWNNIHLRAVIIVILFLIMAMLERN